MNKYNFKHRTWKTYDKLQKEVLELLQAAPLAVLAPDSGFAIRKIGSYLELAGLEPPRQVAGPTAPTEDAGKAALGPHVNR